MERTAHRGVIATILLVAILVISSLVLVYQVPVGQEYAGMPQISGISNNIGQSINVTFSRVSYINEPTQWQVGPANPQNGTYKASGAWILNNSGYLIMQQNTSSPTAPTLVDYNFSAATASLTYFYMDQRFALNGSAKAYIDISESNITGLPATAGSLAASAGKAQNQLNVNITSVATGYNLTVGYFALNSKGYENYTTIQMTPAKTLLPLVFYEIGVYATPTKTTVYLFDTMNGTALASASFNATINGNLSKLDNVAYEVDSSGSMILSFAYYLNHNTYTSSSSPAIATPFVAMTDQSVNENMPLLPFDPSTTNSSYTQGPTSTSDYRGAQGSLNDFSSVIQANDPASAATSLINRSRVVTSTVPLSSYAADNITNTLRDTNASGLSFNASIHVNGFNTTDIMEALQNFLQGYLYQKLGTAVFPAGPKQVDITFYIITSISVNLNFGSSTASSIASSLDSAIPGILSAHHLSIVDSATSAVAAGEYAGDFMAYGSEQVQTSAGMQFENVPIGVAAIATPNGIMDPANNVMYPSLQAAGFPSGSYVSNGHVVVPQVQFFGFNAQGEPLFNEPLSLIGLSGAALAAQGYFHSALPSIYNVANSSLTTALQSPYRLEAQIGATSHAITGAVQDTIKAAQNYLPFIGATVANIGASINTGLTGTTVGNLGHSILTTTSQTVGALLAGATSSDSYIYRLGASMSEQPGSFYSNASNIQTAVTPDFTYSPDWSLFGAISNAVSSVANSVYSTAKSVASTVSNTISGATSNFVNDAEAVVTPVYTTVKNLGTTAVNDVKAASTAVINATQAAGKSIYSAVQGTLSEGAGALNTAGHDIVTGLNSAGHTVVSAVQTVAGKISNFVASAASTLSNAAHGVFNWITGIFHGVVGWLAKYWIYIVLGIVGIIIAAIVILGLIGRKMPVA